MMKFIPLAALAIAAMTVPVMSAQARTHVVKHRPLHRHYARSHEHAPRYGRSAYDGRGAYYGRGPYGGPERFGYPVNPYDVPAYSRTGRVPVGTYGEAVPFRTVQPTDVGIGALAPNGYRGPGTASGGPAGGIDTGGGR